jgi:triacylglycerol esterase/lipase EstA (alpha/beta hydrolase family)
MATRSVSSHATDAEVVRTQASRKQSISTQIAVFFDGQSYSNFSAPDPVQVAGISVLNKADEVAQVLRAITTLTHVKDVIVVSHSMGGLDARAYMQNKAVPLSGARCTDSYA